MQASELARLGIDKSHRARLDREIESFDQAVPAAKPARDILEHFDEYARGEGRLQLEAIRNLGLDVYEAAAMYWGGGYDPATEELSEGPFTLNIPSALEAAKRLQRSIYVAGRAVDATRSRDTTQYASLPCVEPGGRQACGSLVDVTLEPTVIYVASAIARRGGGHAVSRRDK
jgi:hypothetical protein